MQGPPQEQTLDPALAPAEAAQVSEPSSGKTQPQGQSLEQVGIFVLFLFSPLALAASPTRVALLTLNCPTSLLDVDRLISALRIELANDPVQSFFLAAETSHADDYRVLLTCTEADSAWVDAVQTLPPARDQAHIKLGSLLPSYRPRAAAILIAD